MGHVPFEESLAPPVDPSAVRPHWLLRAGSAGGGIFEAWDKLLCATRTLEVTNLPGPLFEVKLVVIGSCFP